MIFVLAFMLALPILSFGETVADMDGNDWISFSEERKTFIILGVMMASAMNYEASNTLKQSGDITGKGSKVLSDLNNMEVQVGYVIDKVDQWYNKTREWDTELYYIIFGAIGNLDSMVKLIEKMEKNKQSLKEL